MNIVVLMAGAGKRFENYYQVPKPLIPITSQKTMVQMCLESSGLKGNYIFITRKFENPDHNKVLNEILDQYSPNSKVIEIEKLSNGPAETALFASELINNNEELVIMNCDHILTWDPKKFHSHLRSTDKDGIVVTYTTDDPSNSFIKIDHNGNAIQLAEKRVISNDSLNGIHYWKEGRYFVQSAREMMERNIRVNNEFYIAPTYNILIEKSYKISNYSLKEGEHIAVGTPKDLEQYLKSI